MTSYFQCSMTHLATNVARYIFLSMSKGTSCYRCWHPTTGVGKNILLPLIYHVSYLLCCTKIPLPVLHDASYYLCCTTHPSTEIVRCIVLPVLYNAFLYLCRATVNHQCCTTQFITGVVRHILRHDTTHYLRRTTHLPTCVEWHIPLARL